MYKDKNEFKNSYQPKVHLIKDENGGDLIATYSIIDGWKNYFSKQWNSHATD
jgi:hypothetical protein